MQVCQSSFSFHIKISGLNCPCILCHLNQLPITNLLSRLYIMPFSSEKIRETISISIFPKIDSYNVVLKTDFLASTFLYPAQLPEFWLLVMSWLTIHDAVNVYWNRFLVGIQQEFLSSMLHTWNTAKFQQYSIHFLDLWCINKLWFQKLLLALRLSCHITLLFGG